MAGDLKQAEAPDSSTVPPSQEWPRLLFSVLLNATLLAQVIRRSSSVRRDYQLLWQRFDSQNLHLALYPELQQRGRCCYV